MANQKMIALGENRSVIRDLFEYGLTMKKEVGEDKVFDFSIGNPSIPAPKKVDEALIELIKTVESTSLHGYSSAPGDARVREIVAASLQRRFVTAYYFGLDSFGVSLYKRNFGQVPTR